MTAGLCAGALLLATPEVLYVEGDISPIHDPSIIKADIKLGNSYYLFASNWFHQQLLPIFRSEDLRAWKFYDHVFAAVPEWAAKEIPGARGIWAPDISYTRGQFRLYYAVSRFGSNHSVIGLATNHTLDANAPGYRWQDQGRVIGTSLEDDWNAIDPSVAVDKRGRRWLVMGSFWSGIKLRKLNSIDGKLSDKDTTLYALANRQPETPPAVEAPYIIRHGAYYYLFVSFDLCCRGVRSTYKIMVGRSAKITGPYLDRNGRRMLEGGGTLLMAGTPQWRGPGGESILRGIAPAGHGVPRL